MTKFMEMDKCEYKEDLEKYYSVDYNDMGLCRLIGVICNKKGDYKFCEHYKTKKYDVPHDLEEK